MYILIKTNDFYDSDNIDARIQIEKYDTYEQAYEAMKNEVIKYLKIDDDKYEKYLPSVLDHVEYSNVYLGEWSARNHRDYGELNNYWKIISV